MSTFSDNVRRELLSSVPQKGCCRKSMLAGLFINAECGIDGSVYARFSMTESADLAVRLLKEVFGKEVTPEYSNIYGKTGAEIVTSSDRISEMLSELSDPGKVSEPLSFLRCAGCRKAFAAGILLASSALSNPEKESRAEIRINDPIRASAVIAFYGASGLYPILSARNGNSSLIFKNSDAVEILLGQAGAVNSSMDMMQHKMVRELRGDINRRSNCEINNIVRTAGASRAQAEAIDELKRSGEFGSMSDELRETAELRLAYPEASLAELASLHNPPITKSGLNHRLEKIIAAAGNCRKEDR